MLIFPAILRSLACGLVAAGTCLAAGPDWLTNLDEAQARAATEKKDLLVDFTGSDWCGFCIQLSQEVFEQDAFAKSAPEHFVLVELDFPRDTTGIPGETVARNEDLAREYRVQGFPTIILMDAQGRPYARSGYRPGGVEKYLAHLDDLRSVRVQRDRHFATAAEAEGVSKARALAEALELLPEEDVDAFYGDQVAAITEADPEDEAGFQQARTYRKDEEAFTRRMESFLGAGKLAEAEAAIEAFLTKHNPEGAARQEILMGMVMVHMERRNPAAALAQLDAIKALDPDSEVGQRVDRFKEGIKSYLKQEESQEEGSSE